VTVSFTPTAAGTANGTLAVQHTGAGSPQVIPLIGQGRTILDLDSPEVDFGQQLLNTPTIGWEGMGNGTGWPAVTVSSVTVEGTDFKLVSNGCPSVYPPFTGCGAIQISFTPTQLGLRTGTFTVVADDSSTPHVAILKGTGVSKGEGGLSPANLDFGEQVVSTQSSAQTVSLTNNGTGMLKSVSIAPSSQFTASSTCGATLAVGASCNISVKFAPSLYGILQGTLSVEDDGAGSPHIVSLTGIGK